MVEPLLFVAILGVAVAIGIPQLLARGEAREQILSAQCIKNLFLIKEGGDPSAFVCPISERPYQPENRHGDEVLSCPDAGKHLRFELSLVRRGASWELHSGLPDNPRPANGVLQLEESRTFFEYEPETVTIQKPPPPPWRRYLLRPAVVIFLGLLFLAPAIVFLSEYRLWGPGEAVFSVIVILFLLAVGAYAIEQVIYTGIHRQEITLSATDKTLTVQDYYLGRVWNDPEELPSVRGVFPVFADDRFRAIAIYEDEGQIRHRTLFKSSGSDWKAVSLLNDLFASRPK